MEIKVVQVYIFSGSEPINDPPWIITIIHSNSNVMFSWGNSSGHHVGEFSLPKFTKVFKLHEPHIIDKVLTKYK